jgi:superfamily I DNA/RNA helicase
VSLYTIHAAKGLEFEHVYLVGAEEGILPHKKTVGGSDEDDVGEDDGAIEEERRLFYVALTRAKRGLSISYAKSRVRYGREFPTEPSRFLGEMGTEGVVVQDGTSKGPASPEFRKRALAALADRYKPKEAP